VHLGIRARLAVLPRGLYYRNLSLLEGPFYLYVIAFYVTVRAEGQGAYEVTVSLTNDVVCRTM
jgi:hypothetical protein